MHTGGREAGTHWGKRGWYTLGEERLVHTGGREAGTCTLGEELEADTHWGKRG